MKTVTLALARMQSIRQLHKYLRAELELLRTLSEAEDDVRAGRIAPVEDTFSALRESLLMRKQR